MHSALHSNHFFDRYGKAHTLPEGTKVKPRLGIFGITIDTNKNLLVACPPAAPDKPGLPGGGREGIETHARALQREYFEELGPYFVIKRITRPVYHQRILYYAFDRDEYWHYEQYFYVVNVHHPKTPASWWTTPEGGRAAWLPLHKYPSITISHKTAIEYHLMTRRSGKLFLVNRRR
jgi:8-oxo-dGTP pyrophosphatase MutT (NUDIX family)